MKSLVHLLAEAANANADGTFTVFNGGITDINTAGFPALTKVAMITRLEISLEEANERLHQMRLRITEEGQSLGPELTTPLAVKVSDPTKPIYINSIATLNLLIPRPGLVRFEVWIDDMAMPFLYLSAVQLGARPT